MWIVGGRPYSEEIYHIEIEPENAFIGDPSLGIALRPGEYDITLNEEVHFHTTHLTEGRRKVAFKTDSSYEKRISILGCSYTYGYGVNDDEHFTSLLQKEFPTYNFSNHGVIGYGTSQSYLQCKELCESADKPDEIFLMFSAAHFDRNTMTPQYRRAMGIGFGRSMDRNPEGMSEASFPYYTLEDERLKLNQVKWSEMYEDWWGRSFSASINWLQTQMEIYERHQMKVVEVTAALIREMNENCQEAGIDFKLFILDNSDETNELSLILDKEDIKTLDIDFNFNDGDLTNSPYDEHPNPKGHQYITNKIIHFLEE